MPVHNLMEDIVMKLLKNMISVKNELKALTPSQLDDVAAIALNRLPHRYTTTHRGEVIVKSQITTQLESDVYRELTEAIRIVTSDSKK